jgi:peptide/nickel transport system permease protein
MIGFAVRRLLVSVLVVFAASFLVFAMVANASDPLGDLRGRNPPPAPEVIQARRHLLNLDKPVTQRYWIWLSHFVRGDMGRSIARNEDVGHLLFQRLGVTLRMIFFAMLLAIVMAVLVGVFSAIKQYSALDYVATFAGFLFLATPIFWLAALLKIYGAIKVNGWLGHTVVYTIGDSSSNLTGSLWHRLGDEAGHLLLPTIALALISFAAWSRYQRASMLDVLNSDYVRLARAKGVPARKVITKHALRNALIPLTTVVAIDFGAIFGGAVITEIVFQWQGMGRMLLDAVEGSDTNQTLAWLMASAIIVILFNLVADILYAYLDPRIRYG